MASKEQRSNREKKKPKQDKKKSASAPSPFSAPAQKGGKPTGSPPPFQQGIKK